MKKTLLFLSICLSINAFAQLEGTWKMTQKLGAFGVGPNQGDQGWWQYLSDGNKRECFMDDRFVFNADGTFENQLDSSTWLETWQGVAEGCGKPVSPHDGSVSATWSYDETAKTITIVGKGAYLGLPKVTNTTQLTDPANAPDSIVYTVTSMSASNMVIDINYGGGWWRYDMTKDDGKAEPTENIVDFSADDAWGGYVNVFDFAGAYMFGSGWAIPDIKTTIDKTNNTMTLQPNFNLYGDGTDPYWAKDGKGQKNVEANTEVENATLTEKDFTFKGSVLSNTLDTSYDAYFHIVALDPNNGYQDALGGAGRKKLPSSGNFSVTIKGDDLKSGLIVKYGFRIFGVNANPADETALGSIVIGETQPEFVGRWKLAPQANAMGVGENQGNISWWSNTAADVDTRHCLFADHYVFNADGSFENDLAEHTWLETWQGADEGCGEPVAPHDGSNAATWSYDASAKTVTLVGKGAYLGLSKVTNTTQLTDPADAADTITYQVTEYSDTTLLLDIDYGAGWWRFNFVRTNETMSIDSVPKDTGDTSGFILNPEWGSTNIYPNPANNFVQIQSAEKFVSYHILNQLGQTVLVGDIVDNRISVAELNNGVYFITITNEDNLGFVKKLIIKN